MMFGMVKDEWGSVRVPYGLIREVEKLLNSSKAKKMGWTSVASVVQYLIQREIDRYSKD